jgi:hypothetical protein
VHERIRSISHQGKQVFLADCSNCSALDVEKIMTLRNHFRNRNKRPRLRCRQYLTNS